MTRTRLTAPPERLRVFYHAALMPGWEAIAEEQLDLLRFVGLTTIEACCLGAGDDVARFSAMAARCEIDLRVHRSATEFSEFENPSLCELWKSAREGPGAAYLYFHTKGVSSPSDPVKRRWRRAMQKYVIAAWRENLGLLATFDAVGANWQELPRLSHFSGNFWMARGDWLASLPDPVAYRESGRHIRIASRAWNQMHAETWLGSLPGCLVRSRAGMNMDWWRTGQDLALVDVEIAGFSYEPYDRENWAVTS